MDRGSAERGHAFRSAHRCANPGGPLVRGRHRQTNENVLERTLIVGFTSCRHTVDNRRNDDETACLGSELYGENRAGCSEPLIGFIGRAFAARVPRHT